MSDIASLIRLWEHQLSFHFEAASGSTQTAWHWSRSVGRGLSRSLMSRRHRPHLCTWFLPNHEGAVTGTHVVVEERGYFDAPSALLRDGRLSVYPQVDQKNYFRPSLTSAGLRIPAGGFVGILPLNDEVTVEITPRAPVENLARLMRTVNYQA